MMHISAFEMFLRELPSTPTASILLLGVVLGYLLYMRESSSLRKIPGPFLASLTTLWVFQKQRSFKRPFVDIDLHKKYGPVVRTGPREVIFSSAEAFRTIYSAGSKFSKAEWYVGASDGGYSEPDGLDFLTEGDMEKYRIQRRAVGPAYTEQYMQQIEYKIDQIIGQNNQRMRERAGMVVDIDIFLNLFTSDILSTATFSQSKGLVESNQDDGSIGAIHLAWKYMHVVGYFPFVHRFFAWVAHTNISSKFRSLMKSIFPFFNRFETKTALKVNVFEFPLTQIQQRFAARDEGIPTPGSYSNDIASKLLELQSQKGVLKDNWIRNMCMTNFGAGAETTAIVIGSFIEHIVSHPGLQELIYREINTARKEGRLSNPPKLREMKEQLPFLSACLNESMRLHPVVGMPLLRIVPAEGCEIGGVWIPGGTTVGVNPWVLSRSKELYGEDADVWRPERWLEYSKKELRHLETYNITFGAGVRSCPGKHLAQAMYSKMIPMLFGDLKWRFTNPDAEKVLQCTFSTRFMKLMMQWEEREKPVF